jgi:hypothetical protein
MDVMAKKERNFFFLEKILITEKHCVSGVTMTTA